ncbi:hypothetical protein BT93_F1368 [Corymbia citriodora subsp. variegata]|nr:hypothetical protein BT93_F1368 [Corymbia citriodora subsp. variegata]
MPRAIRRETTTRGETSGAIYLVWGLLWKALTVGAAYGISIFQKISEVTGIKAKMDDLEMDMQFLSARKDDLVNRLKQEERRPGKRRKKVVEVWMQSVGSLEKQVHDLGRKVEEGHFFSHLILKDQVSGLATKVKNLHDMRRYDNGLTLDVILDHGPELRLGEQSRTNESTPLPDRLQQCPTNEPTLFHDCLDHLPPLELEGRGSEGSELQLSEQSQTNESTPLPDCLNHLPLLKLEGLESGGSEPQLGEQSQTNQWTPLGDYLNLLPLWELEIVRLLENLHLTPCRGLQHLEEPRENSTFGGCLSTLPPITAAF